MPDTTVETTILTSGETRIQCALPKSVIGGLIDPKPKLKDFISVLSISGNLLKQPLYHLLTHHCHLEREV